MSSARPPLAPPPHAAADWTVPQDWASYRPAEHALWDTLFERQAKMLPGRVSPAFLEGLDVLRMSRPGIPDFDELSDRLLKLTGWKVVAVPGLVPDEDFFRHLANRTFVAGRFIRTPEQIDYLQEPDIFHDVFGHVPLLANPVFADYMQAYGEGGLRSLRLNAMHRLARLYWYTVEFGLIREQGDLRLYGAGIVSSFGESVFALDDPSPHRIRLNLKRAMRTRYKIDDYQQTYFVIDSFEDLLRQTLETDFAPLYAALDAVPDLPVDAVLPEDEVITLGTQAYAATRTKGSERPQATFRRSHDPAPQPARDLGHGSRCPLEGTLRMSQQTINPQSIDNPMGLDGFEFAEFTSPDPDAMKALIEQLGFTAYAQHPTKNVVRYKQGRINLLVNQEPTGQAADFRRDHGPSANGMAFRVADAKAAFEMALERGARPARSADNALGPDAYVLEGIGGSLLYLVDRYGDRGSIYDSWIAIPGAAAAEAKNGVGLEILDHLTHNVRRGEMRTWSSFYGRIFGFEEQKYFDIKGQATGLFSQAMIAPDKAIRIPLNESQDDTSQIEEFIRDYKGEGIQHLALATDDIYTTVEKLRARGVKLQDTIDTYYELVDTRIPGHGEDLQRLRNNRILIDGDMYGEGLLLQIFTENLFGPIFFEIIQRKGNQGFGNGNFQALFESIELDQIRRGVITVDA